MTGAPSIAPEPVRLDDKYRATSGHVYLTGSQALVRLPIMQRQRDAAAGLKTAGFISGYRGSPLGIYDLALWQAKGILDENDIRFEPGVNEDLAATAVWGTQQVNLVTPSSYDGVFAMWYGARFFASSPLTRARMSWPSHCERWAASSEPCS